MGYLEEEFITFFRACSKSEKEAIINDLRELSKEKAEIHVPLG